MATVHCNKNGNCGAVSVRHHIIGEGRRNQTLKRGKHRTLLVHIWRLPGSSGTPWVQVWCTSGSKPPLPRGLYTGWSPSPMNPPPCWGTSPRRCQQMGSPASKSHHPGGSPFASPNLHLHGTGASQIMLPDHRLGHPWNPAAKALLHRNQCWHSPRSRKHQHRQARGPALVGRIAAAMSLPQLHLQPWLKATAIPLPLAPM
mmetsp:Transcript_85564/g.215784  ORF Transcript_85564/g.215784 Transcript_85564/m.215784 type:complete len:201 (+) Transcript_85564:21-623(+)